MKRGSSVLFLLFALAAAAQTAPKSERLTDLSVDDLLNVQVTSVARRGQKLSETTAAVYVITQEDIRRSGATTIPDLLRMVPGFAVAQVNGNIWAVTARGFNGRTSNKVLILIDGRSADSQIYYGIEWNTIDFFLEDIDRIEVTRGPGGTLWGPNAMNGVINIITKHAVDTQGAMGYASHGVEAGPSAGARYGGHFGTTGYYRAYAKKFDRPSTSDDPGQPFHDRWSMLRSGFRADWTTRFGAMNVQGNIFSGESAETTNLPTADLPFGGDHPLNFDLGGHDIMFRWVSTQSQRSETMLVASLDVMQRASDVTSDRMRNFDLDFQHHLTRGRHDGTWGVELRSIAFRSDPSTIIHLSRTRDADMLLSAYVQDEITLTPSVRITAGTKVVRDPVSSLQWQPSLRALWLPGANQSVWGAITRSVRIPSQFERFSQSEVGAAIGEHGQATNIVLLGDRELEPERQWSYEIGYRARLAAGVTFDLTAYKNALQRVITVESNDSPGVVNGQTVIPAYFRNDFNGTTSGAEALLTLRPIARWDVSVGYSFWHRHLQYEDDYETIDVPLHQAQLQSYFTITPRLEADAFVYYVGAMHERGVPGYTRVDARLAWQATPHVELSFVGRNLTDKQHVEFAGLAENPAITPVKRSLIGAITWRY
jgi:iron complex outermembrane receptor protein